MTAVADEPIALAEQPTTSLTTRLGHFAVGLRDAQCAAFEHLQSAQFLAGRAGAEARVLGKLRS